MDQSEILSAFNRHLIDFFNDIERVFPEDLDIKTAKSSLIGIRKMNPKLIIKIWDSHIGLPYKDQIERGDIDFFINKDYSLDLKDNQNSSLIISKISTLREPIKKLGNENLSKTIKYIQNLSKISKLYNK
jgi:hypothetical protein